MTKTYKTIQEVHPEIIQLWERAWEMQPTKDKPWELVLDTEQHARSMRQRMYSSRKKLLAEGYPDSVNFNKMELRVVGCKLQLFLPSWITIAREALQKEGVSPAMVKGFIVPTEPTPGAINEQQRLLSEMFPQGDKP